MIIWSVFFNAKGVLIDKGKKERIKFAKMVKYVISFFHKFPYIIDDGWNFIH
jgi:hypothetical protein